MNNIVENIFCSFHGTAVTIQMGKFSTGVRAPKIIKIGWFLKSQPTVTSVKLSIC